MSLTTRLSRIIQNQFAEATVSILANGNLSVTWGDATPYPVEILTTPLNDDFSIVTPFLAFAPAHLKDLRADEFLSFVAYENFGLRGVSLLGATEKRALFLKTSFLAPNAEREHASQDEIETLVTDLINLPAHAETIGLRIEQCSEPRSGGEKTFSLLKYLQTFYQKELTTLKLAHPAGRLFKGDAQSVFNHIQKIFTDDLQYPFEVIDRQAARIKIPELSLDTLLKIPADCPILTLWTPIIQWPDSFTQASAFVNSLNLQTQVGHFELLSQGDTMAHVAFKPLTHETTPQHIELLLGSIVKARALTEKSLPDFLE